MLNSLQGLRQLSRANRPACSWAMQMLSLLGLHIDAQDMGKKCSISRPELELSLYRFG